MIYILLINCLLLLFFRKYKVLYLSYLGFAAGIFASRTLARKMIALTNVYEVIMFVIIVLLIINFKRLVKGEEPYNPWYLVLVQGSLLLPFINKEISIISDSLRTPLLPVHVGLTMLGLVYFIIAGGASVRFLIKPEGIPFPNVHRLVKIGYYLWITGAILIGMVYAELSWGRFWSWDVKETWSLVVALYYGFYFYQSKLRSDKVKAVLVILGLALIVFNFFGVNYLFNGLHTYG